MEPEEEKNPLPEYIWYRELVISLLIKEVLMIISDWRL
jgi:hypothetical protein